MFRDLTIAAALLWAVLLASGCFIVQPDPTEDNLYSGLNATARFIADPEQATEFNRALWEAQNQRDRDAQAAALALEAAELAALEAKHEQSRAIADRWLLGIGIVAASLIAALVVRVFYMQARAAAYRDYLAAQQPPGYGIVPRRDPRFRDILLAEGGYYQGSTPMMDGQEVTSLAIPWDRFG